jgi:hypothetical protein
MCLSHVPSAIGKLKFMDSITKDQIKLGFTSVLVEVDVNYEFSREITLEDEDGKLKQSFCVWKQRFTKMMTVMSKKTKTKTTCGGCD